MATGAGGYQGARGGGDRGQGSEEGCTGGGQGGQGGGGKGMKPNGWAIVRCDGSARACDGVAYC